MNTVLKICFAFQLKMRSVNFILIKNLCTVDLFGALFILPVPLIATIKGQWDFPTTFCAANSIVNVALWFQHIVMFAMLKIDRVLASCLPFGKYPLLNVEAVNGLILATWVFSFFVAALVTVLFQSSYEPAVVLCIPDLPIGFFIAIFTVYCVVLCAMVIGYITVLICLKKKQAQIQNTNMVQTKDYKGLEKAALTRYVMCNVYQQQQKKICNSASNCNFLHSFCVFLGITRRQQRARESIFLTLTL